VLLAALVVSLSVALPAFAQIRVTAAWDPNTDGLTAGYMVFVGTSPGAEQHSLDAGSDTSAVLPLPLGAVYYISVRAYDALRQVGPASNQATLDLASSPGAPEGLQASVNGSVASLAWAPPSTGFATGYLLTVGTAPGAQNLLAEYPVGNITTVSGPLPVGTYYARVQANNFVGIGPTTAEVMFRVGSVPGTPANLSSTWSGSTVTLSWAPSPGATSYALEVGSSSGASNLGVFDLGGVTSFSAPVPAGRFYVRVRGVNATGASAPSNELVVQRGTVQAPGAPRNLTSSGSGSTVTLQWAAPATGGTPTAYVLEVGSASGLANLGAFNVGQVTTLTTSAPPGQYYVRVRALNESGQSSPSNQIVVQR
jgi:hypothetical protein